MVYYIFALFTFAIPQISANEEDDITSCLELFKPERIELNCCEIMKMLDKNDFQACKTDGEWECENAKCVLEKSGILSGDTIDEKKTVDMLEKIKEKYPEAKEMAERVNTECLGGKYEDYPPKESCPLIRFQICSYLNSLVASAEMSIRGFVLLKDSAIDIHEMTFPGLCCNECNNWNQSDQCKTFSNHAKTCKSVLDKLKE